MDGEKQTTIERSKNINFNYDCVQFDELENGDAIISFTTDARNLGVIMDKSLNMEDHIQKHQSLSLETALMCEKIWHRMQQKS